MSSEQGTMKDNSTPDTRSLIVLGLVTIWALRLALHIGLRHVGEDFRYQNFRKEWMKSGYYGYLWRAGAMFMFQAFCSIIVNSSVLYVQIYSNNDSTTTNGLTLLDFIGILIWLIGFIFEWVGDDQLRRHLADKTPGKEKFIKWGLWKYTRHPNYFGESVLWWGIFFITCSIPGGYKTFFAPLFITILVRYISGVPLLEEKYEDNAEFKQYCRETNVFFPWFNTPGSKDQ